MKTCLNVREVTQRLGEQPLVIFLPAISNQDFSSRPAFVNLLGPEITISQPITDECSLDFITHRGKRTPRTLESNNRVGKAGELTQLIALACKTIGIDQSSKTATRI